MAKEWYLLTPPSFQMSGAENDFSSDFEEILDSEIAIDIELYNYDLSECQELKAIVQKSVQDTKLQSLMRHVLVPIGTCKAGMYIKYKNRYWIIVNIVDDNAMYEKAIVMICNWYLTWENQKGKIVQRWANITSASQYNNGETANRLYTLRTDQLLVVLPDDDECLLLHSGYRFVIDRRINIYSNMLDENDKYNTSFSLITYQLTRSDSVIYNYIDSGNFQMLITQDEQHKGDGYYVIDGNGYWICRGNETELLEIPDTEKPSISRCDILYDSNKIYSGFDASEYTAVFYDEDGNIVDEMPEWEIRCSFSDKLYVDYIDNTVIISVDDISLINKSFDLVLKNDPDNPIVLKLTIVGLI